MFKIGCHLSVSKGLTAMLRDALSLEANVVQFFCRNPRGKGEIKFSGEDIAEFKKLLAEHNFGPMLAHGPFIINAASDKPETVQITEELLAGDLRFMAGVPGGMYNIHPGNYLKRSPEEGIKSIAALLNRVMDPGEDTLVLVETMAGKGTEIGRSFEELRDIIGLCRYQEKMGVCLDTCHIWDGGYDIVGNLDGVLEEFDRVIGLKRLKAIHLNDSLNPLGGRKDRHANIGQGKLGLEGIVRIINHPELRDLPFYLETPQNDISGYGAEIALLKTKRSL